MRGLPLPPVPMLRWDMSLFRVRSLPLLQMTLLLIIAVILYLLYRDSWSMD